MDRHQPTTHSCRRRAASAVRSSRWNRAHTVARRTLLSAKLRAIATAQFSGPPAALLEAGVTDLTPLNRGRQSLPQWTRSEPYRTQRTRDHHPNSRCARLLAYRPSATNHPLGNPRHLTPVGLPAIGDDRKRSLKGRTPRSATRPSARLTAPPEVALVHVFRLLLRARLGAVHDGLSRRATTL
jgi:hypothetical protein